MSVRTACGLGLLWLASLAAAGAVTRAYAQAQLESPEARVITGADVGFRVEGMQGTKPTGTWVIRWKGQWVEPTAAKKVVPITR